MEKKSWGEKMEESWGKFMEEETRGEEIVGEIMEESEGRNHGGGKKGNIWRNPPTPCGPPGCEGKLRRLSIGKFVVLVICSL